MRKKLVGLFLAVALVFSLGIPAHACGQGCCFDPLRAPIEDVPYVCDELECDFCM